MHLKPPFAKWRQFCLSLSVLIGGSIHTLSRNAAMGSWRCKEVSCSWDHWFDTRRPETKRLILMRQNVQAHYLKRNWALFLRGAGDKSLHASMTIKFTETCICNRDSWNKHFLWVHKCVFTLPRPNTFCDGNNMPIRSPFHSSSRNEFCLTHCMIGVRLSQDERSLFFPCV